MAHGLGFTGVDHPAIAVSDLEKVTVWYCEILGYEEVARNGEIIRIIRAPDGSFIEMMQQNDDSLAELHRHMSFE